MLERSGSSGLYVTPSCTRESCLRPKGGLENKNQERPREGRSHVNTGRDDWIRTSDPLLPKSLRCNHMDQPPKRTREVNHFSRLNFLWLLWYL